MNLLGRCIQTLLQMAIFKIAASVTYEPLPGEDWGYIDVREGAHMFWYESKP